MVPGTRYARAYRGSGWTDKLSLSSLNEGDVFAIFEEDGTRIQNERASVFRATKAPSLKGGVWGIEAEPFDKPTPELR